MLLVDEHQACALTPRLHIRLKTGARAWADAHLPPPRGDVDSPPDPRWRQRARRP
jgi:hypothetical protein